MPIKDKKKHYLQTRKWALANPEWCKNYDREWRRKKYFENPIPFIFRSAKGRAKRKGLSFNITQKDLIVPKVCPVLGIEIIPKASREMKQRDSSPSIDRIIPSLGYVKGNVRIISNRANRLKSDMTIEECKLILKDLEKGGAHV